VFVVSCVLVCIHVHCVPFVCVFTCMHACCTSASQQLCMFVALCQGAHQHAQIFLTGLWTCSRGTLLLVSAVDYWNWWWFLVQLQNAYIALDALQPDTYSNQQKTILFLEKVCNSLLCFTLDQGLPAVSCLGFTKSPVRTCHQNCVPNL